MVTDFTSYVSDYVCTMVFSVPHKVNFKGNSWIISSFFTQKEENASSPSAPSPSWDYCLSSLLPAASLPFFVAAERNPEQLMSTFSNAIRGIKQKGFPFPNKEKGAEKRLETSRQLRIPVFCQELQEAASGQSFLCMLGSPYQRPCKISNCKGTQLWWRTVSQGWWHLIFLEIVILSSLRITTAALPRYMQRETYHSITASCPYIILPVWLLSAWFSVLIFTLINFFCRHHFHASGCIFFGRHLLWLCFLPSPYPLLPSAIFPPYSNFCSSFISLSMLSWKQ